MGSVDWAVNRKPGRPENLPRHIKNALTGAAAPSMFCLMMMLSNRTAASRPCQGFPTIGQRETWPFGGEGDSAV